MNKEKNKSDKDYDDTSSFGTDLSGSIIWSDED